MKHPEILLHRGRTVFSIGCFTLATYYGITQAVRFIKNKDTSVISQKIFNHAPENKYPTFTICMKGENIYSINEHTLFEKAELTPLQYVDLLEGNGGYRYEYDEANHTYEKKFVNSSSIFKLYNYSILSPSPSDIIIGTHFIARNDFQSTHYGYGEGTVNLRNVPFHVGHRTPDETCFTRDSSDELGLIRVYDEILLSQKLLITENNQNVEIKIIFHYPGQLIDQMKAPSHQFKLTGPNSEMFWEGKISQVSILKNRPKSQTPCYTGDESDDTRIRQHLIKKVGCIPIYWKDLDFLANNDEEICDSRESLAMLKSMISSFNGISDGRSCTNMDTLIINSKKVRQDDKHITIKVPYSGNTYQETENVQDFTFETFFSSLGGFIGIFLGYSILQIPELLKDIPSCARKLKSSAGKVIFIDRQMHQSIFYVLILLYFLFLYIFLLICIIGTLTKMIGKNLHLSNQTMVSSSTKVNDI